MEQVLVTGGAGFIGSHLVDRLIELGYNVTIIDNFASGKRENLNKKAKFIERSITKDLRDIFEEGKFDYVFHLAAQIFVRKSLDDPKFDAEVNILGSLNVIQNCVKYKVKKIIFSSTGGAIYDSNKKIPFTEESEIKPESPYGIAKYTIENYLRVVNNIQGLNYVVLRYSNVYGPRQDEKSQYAAVISKFISSILEGKKPMIFGDGKQTRDFVYVKDVVEANIAALKLDGIYNVSTGREISVNELLDKIKKLLNSDVEVLYEDTISGEVRKTCLSSEKLMKNGWKYKYSLDLDLKKTIDWFKEKY